ncbi:peptidase A1 [Shewanella submarina]|uniref:Peptidase A1 n=1 Tax=Shewanella submarina TaxID=2016376 RepID=A0ABV7GFK1_9GAMM|nr:peptidase A1 [Shewanella submarina]MCL1036780.1 peptidase A1 [Shewanella submarina]
MANLLANGGFCASVRLGSERSRVNLIVDTGSSTLVVHESAYRASMDKCLTPTSWAQEVRYGIGGWLGAVVHTNITLGDGADVKSLTMPDTPLALVHIEEGHTFLRADGFWGLAYHELNPGYDMAAYLTSHGVQPANTYPWPQPWFFGNPTEPSYKPHSGNTSQSDNSVDENRGSVVKQLDEFHQLKKTLPRQDIATCFTLMQARGLVANRFALLTRRSSIHFAKPSLSLSDDFQMLKDDPLNQGLLVLGEREGQNQLIASEVLQRTAFEHLLDSEVLTQAHARTLKVVHDRYYNLNLKAVRWQGGQSIEVADAAAAHINRGSSNAILDSGASLISLPEAVFAPLMAQLYQHLPGAKTILPELIKDMQAVVDAQRSGIDIAALAALSDTENPLSAWPVLEFLFEGVEAEKGTSEADKYDSDSSLVCIQCAPEEYWQLNSPAFGKAVFKLMGPIPNWPAQAVLGLPLFNGYCVEFRRDLGELGQVRFIPLKSS